MSTRSTPKSQDLGANVNDAVDALIVQITDLVGPAPALSVSDKKRSVKLRKGGATVIPTIVSLVAQFKLEVPSRPTATMLAKANQAQSLMNLQQKLATALKQVTDVIFAAQSESWEDATVYYTVLKRLSRTNGDLESQIAPVQQFFAYRSASAIADAKEQKAIRKAAKAAQAAADANAAVAKIQSAKAPLDPATATTAAAAPAPAATPTPVSAPTSAIAHS